MPPSFLKDKRTCGLLAHISSLPSPYGIGDIGPASSRFLEFLADAGQSCWQFLPTGPTNQFFDNSPYMAMSAFAGSPLLLSPDLLVEQGYLGRQELTHLTPFSEYTVHYGAVTGYKNGLLAKAFRSFTPNKAFAEFRRKHRWLDDYALFMSIKEDQLDRPWFLWPAPLAARTPQALADQRERLRHRIDYYYFEQFEFFRQWSLLKQEAGRLNIRLIGDIPIYVALDSADVWSHQEIFALDPKTRRPTVVGGVPPDYFSKTGQRWGNPLYNWQTGDKKTRKALYSWWLERFRAIYTLVDIARIDHFRGFESYWAIPEEEKTAVKGKWLKGPGQPFFEEIFQKLGRLEIIAEDLGIITPEVTALRRDLDFPGMKVLQFAFDGDPANAFLPHNYNSPHSVVYTGTHDNDTSLGWFLSDKLSDAEREEIKRYANRRLHDGSEIHHDLIHLALSSIAGLAVIPLQDLLGFGNDCRMNEPGKKEGNWAWRCAERFLSKPPAQWLLAATTRFGRLATPPHPSAPTSKESRP